MRQRALAQNMANINTPGYRRVDVDFHAQLSSIMARNPSGQLAPANFSASHPAGDSAVRVDGNTVDENMEMSNFSRNALDFQASLTFLQSSLRGLKTALRGE